MTDIDAHREQDLPSGRDDLSRLGSHVVERRKAKGWKQRELARRTGIDPGRLSRIERGITLPQVRELVRLGTALGGDLDDLLFGAGEEGPEGSLGQLAQEVGRLGSRDEIRLLCRFFQLLVLGYRKEQQPIQGGGA